MAESTLPLRRVIVVMAVLFVAAMVASSAYDAWRMHQEMTAATEREVTNLAKAMADESAHTLQTVDLLLRETADWYERSGKVLDAGRVAAALAARSVGVEQVSVLTIVDAGGEQRHRSRQTGEPLANVADRPYFQVQRAKNNVGLYVNPPLVTRTERTPALVVSRRLTATDGSFDGVVTAIVTLQRMQAMYSAIQPGIGSALELAMDDGTVIVQQPANAGRGPTISPRDMDALKRSERLGRIVSPTDGRAKLAAVAGVSGRPLSLAITRDEEVALSPWIDSVWGYAVRAAVVSLLALLAVAAMLRQLRLQEVSARALRESEERYALVMEAANEGHAEWNLRLDTVFVCRKWRELHGLGGDTRLWTSMDAVREVILHAEDLAASKAMLDAHMAGGSEMLELEYRVLQLDGGWRWIHARGRCLLDDAGAPLRLFCSALDVSERKAAEVERADLGARLQQARQLEALGTLAGGIAHDFNNILGAILGFGQMAQQQLEMDNPSRRHIDRVLQAGSRARLLVRRILDFSRSGVVELTPVNIQGVVEEALALLAPSLPSGVAVSAELEAGNATVLGDATQLHQVVMNVCTNAAQAMDAEGTLQVRLVSIELTAPLIPMQGKLAPGAHVRLDVEDSGVGIPQDVLARIFDPFFTTKKVGEGTGLGLSVVHGIVVDLGGGIDVVSSEGIGTRVSIWLPIAGESELPAVGAAGAFPRGRGETVMVVDDEPALVELAEELLAELGYEPVGFRSSELALAALRADPTRFDAVLTDETMPRLQGTELAAAISSLRADLPVILMSGYFTADVQKRASDAGVRALLQKPLSLKLLSTFLAQALTD